MTNDQAHSIVTNASGLEHFRQSAPLADELRQTAHLQMQLASDIHAAYGPVERKAALCDEALAACEAALEYVDSDDASLELRDRVGHMLSAVLAKARASEGVGA